VQYVRYALRESFANCPDAATWDEMRALLDAAARDAVGIYQQAIVEDLEAEAVKARNMKIRDARHKWNDWRVRAMDNGAKAAHRYTKCKPKWMPTETLLQDVPQHRGPQGLAPGPGRLVEEHMGSQTAGAGR
jgi:hypothetical protein